MKLSAISDEFARFLLAYRLSCSLLPRIERNDRILERDATKREREREERGRMMLARTLAHATIVGVSVYVCTERLVIRTKV